MSTSHRVARQRTRHLFFPASLCDNATMGEEINGPLYRISWLGPELIEKHRQEVVRRLYRSGEIVKNHIVRNLSTSTRSEGPSLPGEYPHTDTGKLRQNIFISVDEVNLTATIGTNLLYGLWLELGIDGGAIIRPVNARALSWIGSDGVRRFAASVRQGAIASRPFLRRGLYETLPQVRAVHLAPFTG
jgi:hypothetical protein